jgi:hypothetical protein
MLRMRLSGNKWLEQKHKTKRKRRSWRKLHLGLNLFSGQIVCSDLTADDIGDQTALPGLLVQIGGRVDLFLADGAYDGEPTVEALSERFGATIKVTIPPPKNAILSPDAAQNPSIRDRHIADITAHGCMAWQKSSCYNQRSRIETHPLMHAMHALPGSGSAVGRPSSGPSSRRATLEIRKQRPRLASGSLTG